MHRLLVIGLTVLAAVLFTVGWVTGRVWGAVAWTIAAVQVGWHSARVADRGR